ncbi:MAG: hypothetical protein EBS29_13565, partial [Chloroflexia bacterium]|nr:hypothetical protein [Chloroflexia bacterium]
MFNRVTLFVVSTILLTLCVPTTRVDERMLGRFGADLADARTQGLAMFGLPIKIPRHPRPIATPIANKTVAANTVAQNDIQAADLVLALLERANLVQMVTIPLTPSPTPTPTVLATATIVKTMIPSATPTQIPVATATALATATITPPLVSATPPREVTATAPAIVTNTVPLLPNSILDGFRAHMPPSGYWQSSAQGVYIAVGSFRYLQ